LAGIDVKLADQHIQIAALVAHIHSEPGGVINNKEGESEGDGESSTAHAFVISDRSQERNSEGGVRARHMAVGHNIMPIPAVFQGIKDKFNGLNNYADNNRDHNKVVR